MTKPAVLPSQTFIPAPEAGEEKAGFDFRRFWHALLERFWIVVLCAVLGLLLALGYLARTPKLYQGHIVLEVDFQEPTVVDEGSANRGRVPFLASEAALRTIEQKLVNHELLARVVRAEGLAEDGGKALLGENVSGPSTTSSSTTASPTPRDSFPAAGPAATFSPLEQALGGALSTMVEPVIRKGTRLIDVYVRNRDPALAQRLANAVGREYIRNAIEHRSTFNEESLRYLTEEEERLKQNLQKNEVLVGGHSTSSPVGSQFAGAAAIAGQTNAGSSSNGSGDDGQQDLGGQLASLRAERMRLEMELQQIERMGDNVEGLLAIPSIASAAPVSDARRDVAQMEANVAALAQRYKEKHPKMMAARAALAEAKDVLRRAALAQPAMQRNVLEQTRAAEGKIDTSTQAQVQTDRALYESVVRQIKDLDLTKDERVNAASVIQQSAFPNQPVSPKPLLAIGLGLVGGLAVGLGLIFTFDSIDRSIKTVDQAESILDLPVLAAIPETQSGQGGKQNNGTDRTEAGTTYRLVAEAPEGAVAESFRNLRASLSLLGPEVERKVFLFTSALPTEGKSFTSANFALALAQQGHRVLLIDGDLRRPSLDKIFLHPSATSNGGKERHGVVDYLVGQTSLAEALQRIETKEVGPAMQSDHQNSTILNEGQLSLLAGGQRAPNPAELLGGASFGKLVAEAARLFDRVVIDSAPVLAVSDTLLMVAHAQTVGLVVRAAKTPRNAVRRAIALLATASIQPAGVILNRLPWRRGGGYYYYYASHGYGAGEGSYGGTGKR